MMTWWLDKGMDSDDVIISLISKTVPSGWRSKSAYTEIFGDLTPYCEENGPRVCHE